MSKSYDLVARTRLAAAALLLAAGLGCESRVVSAKGIGSERYDTQPTFEEQYAPPWENGEYEKRDKIDEPL
jgi:hypothetical protein